MICKNISHSNKFLLDAQANALALSTSAGNFLFASSLTGAPELLLTDDEHESLWLYLRDTC